MSERAKHTPGPWLVTQWAIADDIGMSDQDINVESADGLTSIASVAGGLSTTEQDANASLIAAAPELLAQRDELLAALQDLCNELHRGRKFNVRKDFALLVADASARKAIAKATGGAL